MVYHGTVHDFSAFDPQAEPNTYESDRGKQFFTSSRAGASGYAESLGEGANVLPVYLAMKNPRIEKVDGDPAAWWDAQPSYAWDMSVTDTGHDGMIVMSRNGASMYVTARPEQIKSATGNSGAFDPSNPSILLSQIEQGNIPGTTDTEQEAIARGYKARVKRALKRADGVINGLGELPDTEQYLAHLLIDGIRPAS